MITSFVQAFQEPNNFALREFYFIFAIIQRNLIKMKPTLLALFLFFLLIKTSHAQDLIITTRGDSLNCKITKITNSKIKFNYVEDGKYYQSTIRKDLVKSYKWVSNSSSEAPLGNKDLSKVRIGLQGGYSYLTVPVSSIPTVVNQYEKELKSGYHFGVDVNLFPVTKLGVGVKYSCFRTKN